MESIILPIDKEVLKQELTSDLFLRYTNKSGNEIYIFSAEQAPNLMREVGRIREECFRAGGGGTGSSCDVDEFDLMPNGYKQLIVWNPEKQVIVGGYRFILGRDVIAHSEGTDAMATSHMFTYSDLFVKDYLPYTIELGRSFVANDFQSTRVDGLSIFALDNLWDGLGALTVIYPEIRYFFGKVTMYKTYNPFCRNLILKFMEIYFKDKEDLVKPITPLPIQIEEDVVKRVFKANNIMADYKTLKKTVREYGINIPPLFSAYISLSPELRMLGTAVNEEFGYVEETGILIAIEHILDEKKKRHIDTFEKNI
ncbi:MAG: GNAT family N-acetyltransferase [Porphyromonas sp.]|nr:GNAT family N-acetyltransferase [Porphyromonas sp.]